MVENSPRKIGERAFFARYNLLVKERFETYWPGQWDLTSRLEDLGGKICVRQVTDEASLLLFLIDVAVWKQPYETQSKKLIEDVCKNRYADIMLAFKTVWQALPERDDRAVTDAIGSLSGFGSRGGSRKIASAVLRFLDPKRFAVVDYRNWVVLSNTEGSFFDKPLLRPLASTIDETKEMPINTENYLRYLNVVRGLAALNSLTPAQIDMALFAYSGEISPLSTSAAVGGRSGGDYHKTSSGRKEEDVRDIQDKVKHQRMVEVVMRVVNDNKRKGHQRAAHTLETALKGCRSPTDIMEMCYNMTTRASYMDLNLAATGTLTLSQIMPELDSIYRER